MSTPRNDERMRIRRFYCAVWKKHNGGQPLEPMEKIIADVIVQHPEYHVLLENDDILDKDFPVGEGESNPFLHMGLHISIHEQLNADRPAGIRTLYQGLMKKTGDAHETEHRIIECLAESIWQAQRNNQMPDEQQYLECVRKLQ